MAKIKQKEADLLNNLLKLLSSASAQGVGITTLSNTVNLPPRKLKKYLKKYPDFFAQMDEQQRYGIDQYGDFKGNVDLMFQEVERLVAKQSSNLPILLGVLGAAIIILLLLWHLGYLFSH